MRNRLFWVTHLVDWGKFNSDTTILMEEWHIEEGSPYTIYWLISPFKEFKGIAVVNPVIAEIQEHIVKQRILE